MGELKRVARRIVAVPPKLMSDALSEVSSIDWSSLPVPDRRSRTPVFRTSTAIHLRVHQVSGETPDTLAAYGEIIECEDTVARALFPATNALVEWMYQEIAGHHLGRAMIVRLDPFGTVGVHVDRGSYFRYHKRLHVPLVTAPEVCFHGEDREATSVHMPAGWLCQLHNDQPHGVTSGWDKHRIHLIVDIASDDERLRD